jgi:hypothetical protein
VLSSLTLTLSRLPLRDTPALELSLESLSPIGDVPPAENEPAVRMCRTSDESNPLLLIDGTHE